MAQEIMERGKVLKMSENLESSNYKCNLNKLFSQTDSKEYGKRICMEATSKKLDAELLADKVGSNRQEIISIFKGTKKKIDIVLAAKFCRTFKCSIFYLLGYTDKPKESLTPFGQYLAEHNISLLQTIKTSYPDLIIGSDISVGFYKAEIDRSKKEIKENDPELLEIFEKCSTLSAANRKKIRIILLNVLELAGEDIRGIV